MSILAHGLFWILIAWNGCLPAGRNGIIAFHSLVNDGDAEAFWMICPFKYVAYSWLAFWISIGCHTDEYRFQAFVVVATDLSSLFRGYQFVSVIS